jgi:aspartyl aminopeptidase
MTRREPEDDRICGGGGVREGRRWSRNDQAGVLEEGREVPETRLPEELDKKAAGAAWRRYGEDPRTEEYAAGLIRFLSECKTETEAVAEGVRRFEEARFVDLASVGPGTLRPGMGVYMNFKDRALAAARIGTAPIREGVRIVAAHADSPRIDWKPRPLYEDWGLAFADTHYYGGIKKYQWTNVPLALHGAVFVPDGVRRPVRLGEEAGDPVLLVPDLAPHLDRDLDKRKASETILAENLDVLLASRPMEEKGPKQTVLNWLKEVLGVEERDLASAELSLVPAGSAREAGLDRSLVASYGIDDRACVFAAFEALLKIPSPRRTALVLALDREEIGSEGVGGAQGALLDLFLLGILRGLGEAADETGLRFLSAASEAISADVCEAGNPLYREAFDARPPLSGGGICLMKFTGSRGKYDASEARGEFVARLLGGLDRENVPWQVGNFGKVDRGGGGTIAKYLARTGMDVADLGPAVLSLHAPVELIGKADAFAASEAYRVFLGG